MVAQGIKGILHNASKWEELTSAEAESIDLIVTKLARIVVGSYQEDNWLDIEGYATLARREGRQRK